jgi:hypothetical protein
MKGYGRRMRSIATELLMILAAAFTALAIVLLAGGMVWMPK